MEEGTRRREERGNCDQIKWKKHFKEEKFIDQTTMKVRKMWISQETFYFLAWNWCKGNGPEALWQSKREVRGCGDSCWHLFCVIYSSQRPLMKNRNQIISLCLLKTKKENSVQCNNSFFVMSGSEESEF